jgi:glutaredoxin 3
MAVKIYTTSSCPWCAKTKAWLKQNKVKFTEKDVQENEKARGEMIKKSGQMGVPVIDINDEILVGFDPKAMQKALNKKVSKRGK